MSTKQRTPLEDLPKEREERFLKAAQLQSDPALVGVVLVVNELVAVTEGRGPMPGRLSRWQGLLRLAVRDVPREPPGSAESYMASIEAVLTGLFGRENGRAVAAAWPFVQEVANAFESHTANTLTNAQALQHIIAGASAVLVAGGGEQGRKLLQNAVARELAGHRAGWDDLHDQLGKRPLKSHSFHPKGDLRRFRAFLRAVAKTRLTDAYYESQVGTAGRSVRRYRQQGFDVSTPQGVTAAVIDGKLRQGRVPFGLCSGHSAAKALGIAQSSFRKLLARAHRVEPDIGVRTPPTNRLYFTEDHIKRLRRYLPRARRSPKSP